MLNIAVTGLALVELYRAYLLSQSSLHSVKELTGNILANMEYAMLTATLREITNEVNPQVREMLGLQGFDLQ